MAGSYGERFGEMITGFRERTEVLNLPVIAGELGRFLALNPYYKESATVVAQTEQVLDSLENAAFVSSEGISCDGGHTHIGTDSIREFGLRYARAFLEVLG